MNKKENNLTILEITNIIWENSEKNKKELPAELALQWNNKEWDYNQVSSWLTEYFKVTVNSFNVKESEKQTGG